MSEIRLHEYLDRRLLRGNSAKEDDYHCTTLQGHKRDELTCLSSHSRSLSLFNAQSPGLHGLSVAISYSAATAAFHLSGGEIIPLCLSVSKVLWSALNMHCDRTHVWIGSMHCRHGLNNR